MSHIRYGEELAEELGFDLHHTTNISAYYSKLYREAWIGLEVFPDKYNEGKLEAKLSTIFRMSRLELGKFSFPNSNYSIFEDEIKHIIDKVGPIQGARF